MNVDDLLKRDAARVASAVGAVDLGGLLQRVIANVEAAPPSDLPAPHRAGCLPLASPPLSPLAEVRHRLEYASSSPWCARRTAELFDLLGDDRATTWWRRAAYLGDRDAQEYVAAFIDLADGS